MSEVLKNYIHQLLPMPLSKIDLVIQDFKYIELANNHFLLKENNISKHTYFLESGFIRSYINDSEGNEVTTNIYSAPCFVNDFLSFFKQQATKENFQTMSPCAMWQISFDQLQVCFHSIPEFREFGRMMLVTNYAKLNDRMISMIKDTAETRYLLLMANHPSIFQQIPLKIIASYLGITDTSLSRIRNKISTK